MKILCAGPSDLKDFLHIETMLAGFAGKRPKPTLFSIGLGGVDKIALEAAQIHGFDILERKIKWKSHDSGDTPIPCDCDEERLCVSAPRRVYWEILENDKPDLVLVYTQVPLTQSVEAFFVTEEALARGIPTYITKTEI